MHNWGDDWSVVGWNKLVVHELGKSAAGRYDSVLIIVIHLQASRRRSIGIVHPAPIFRSGDGNVVEINAGSGFGLWNDIPYVKCKRVLPLSFYR